MKVNFKIYGCTCFFFSANFTKGNNRNTWRSGVRSAMRAASQLPGRGPTVVDMAPIPAR